MCWTPLAIKNKRIRKDDYAHLTVPCGKCPACLHARSSAWVFRMEQENKRHSHSLFVTLTYDYDHVPLSPSGRMSLRKKDFQDFMKRVRKRAGKGRVIKYYACGEYGSQTFRPHFHAIMFGVTESEVRASWTDGHVHVGEVAGASIAYTTKYVNKGKLIPMYQGDDRLPEFSLMSQGLGKNYLTPQMIRYHKEGLKDHVTLPGGKKQPIPRYLRDKIFNDDEKDFLLRNNVQRFEQDWNKRIQEAGSEEQYYHDRHARLTQALYNFKRKQLNRNKI